MKLKKKLFIIGIVSILLISITFVIVWYTKPNSNEEINTSNASEQTETASVEKRDGKYGIINSKGNVIVPFEYDEGYDYKNGIAVLTNKEGSTYFNNNGKIIGFPNTALNGPPETYSKDDYLAYKDSNNGLYGYINQDGAMTLESNWKYANNFCNGLALVGDDTGTYVIDKSGTIAISQNIIGKYSNINPAFEKEILVVYTQDGACGVIDKTGREIIKCNVDNNYIEVTDEKIIVHQSNNEIYYDFNGKKI